jgi:hypothetical protein
MVLRADADDISLPQRSWLQLSTLQARPELAVLSGPMPEFLDNPQQPCGWRTVPTGVQQVKCFSRWRNPINHPAVALRRSRLLSVGGYRAVPGFEDYDLWLRLLAAGEQLDNNSESLVCARVGQAHLGRRRGWRYAAAECAFLWRCGRERLMDWPQVLLLLLLRVPLRLLPVRVLSVVMASLRHPHQPVPVGAKGDGPVGVG